MRRGGRDGRSAKVGFFDPRYRGGDDGRPEIPTGQGNASKPQQPVVPFNGSDKKLETPIIGSYYLATDKAPPSSSYWAAEIG